MLRLSGFFLLVLLSTAILGCPKYAVPKVAQAIQRMCIKAVDSNQLDRAENYCKLALRYNPKFVEALNGLALVEIRRGDLKKAEAYLKKALSINDKFAQARVNLGHIYYVQRKFGRAKTLFKSALDLDPSLRDANYNMARTLVQLHEYKAAADQLTQMFAFTANRRYAPAHYLRGYIEFERKQYRYAVPHFINALRVNPRFTKARFTLCVTLYTLSRFGLACQHCRYALMLNQGHVQAEAWRKKIDAQLRKHNKTCPPLRRR